MAEKKAAPGKMPGMKEPPKIKDPAKVVKRLLSYLKGYRLRFIIVLVCIVISAGASAFSAMFIQLLIDNYIVPMMGQKNPDFYYGNIYRDSMSRIMETGAEKIRRVHASCGFDQECGDCPWLYLCRTGCPFVKRQQKRARSYTCLLQKELYRLWGLEGHDYARPDALDYVCAMHPGLIESYALAKLPTQIPDLRTLIRQDPGLRYIYDPDLFVLNIDGNDFRLESQIIKQNRPLTFITPDSRVVLYVRQGIFEAQSSYSENNALYIQLLTGDTIVYGDEGRTKQRHIANEMIYKQAAETDESDREGWLKIDLTHFLRRYGKYLSPDRENNIFFTTAALRE